MIHIFSTAIANHLFRFFLRIWLIASAMGLLALAGCSSLRANRLKNKSYKEWSKKQEVNDTNAKPLLLHKNN